jgi:hypothetical protein
LGWCDTSYINVEEGNELQQVFEKLVLREMLETEKEGSHQFTILYYKERHYLCRSPTVLSAVKCRRSRWAWELVRMVKQEMRTELCKSVCDSVHLKNKEGEWVITKFLIEIGNEDGTDSGWCPVAGCGISGVEPWGSATTVLVRNPIQWMLLALS